MVRQHLSPTDPPHVPQEHEYRRAREALHRAASLLEVCGEPHRAARVRAERDAIAELLAGCVVWQR